ncbi:hypothetical protein D3D01_20000 [Haloarcula sp. Atlit-7R]|nr:hypothetical protein D3D01_20000 [Haloarcula sp. Atlit-7R]
MIEPEEVAEVPCLPGHLFEVLADVRKRYALYYLQQGDGRGTLTDIADQLVASRATTAAGNETEKKHCHVYTALYHADLPKLADCGLITFDCETGKVTAADKFDAIEPYLHFAQLAEPNDYEQFRGQLNDNE